MARKSKVNDRIAKESNDLRVLILGKVTWLKNHEKPHNSRVERFKDYITH